METEPPNTEPSAPNIDPSVFATLQAKIDAEHIVKDSLRAQTDTLSRQTRVITSHLQRIHNVPTASLQTQILDPVAPLLQQQAQTVQELSKIASQYPFYKYNGLWAREVQNVVNSIQLHEWLSSGRLMSVEEVGTFLAVPVNVKPTDDDVFHITIEDYLLALTMTCEELSRLAPNSVTLGDMRRPLEISRFIKDVHAGFQLLNLKNDTLRRRADGVKYSVKRCEDVVYDLSLRGLVPQNGSKATAGEQDAAGQGKTNE